MAGPPLHSVAGPPLRSVAGTELAVYQQPSVIRQIAVSPALAAAQQKLESLRDAYRPDQIERPALNGASNEIKVGRTKTLDLPKVHNSRPNSLPKHLGWHSGPATRAYHLAVRNQVKGHVENRPSPIPLNSAPSPPPRLPASPDYLPAVSEQSLNLPPDIALAILRNKLAAPGRVWLLLRHLDEQGKGWISAAAARKELTQKQSALAVCSGRQLRNLLTAGDGIFWERDEARIWLKSMARVAAELGLSCLNGRPVKLPLSTLLESIGTVRAHLYATFHSGRSCQTSETGEHEGAPISRKTLENLCAATRRTQQLYEKRVGVQRQYNYAVGPPYSTAEEQNLAWQHGRAVFRFKDRKGVIGKSGQDYLARQLPNSYDGPHEVQSKGYQWRVNRQLADLLNEGITGNGRLANEKDEAETASRTRVFYRNGSKAAEVYNRDPDQDLYWQSRSGRTGSNNRFRIWHTLPALDKEK